MAESHVEMIVRETITETVPLDAQLAEMVRDLVILGLGEARRMLEFGLADQKLVIIRALLSGATRSLGKDYASTEQEAKVAVERIFSSMREVEAGDAAPVAAIAPRVDDPE